MLELALAQTAVDLPAQIDAPSTADTVRAASDGIITFGLLTVGYRLGRRALMGHFLPEQIDGFDPTAATPEPNLRRVAAILGVVLAGVALTTAAVYLLTPGIAWALLWAGVCAFVLGGLGALAYRNATPIDDVRALLAARSQG